MIICRRSGLKIFLYLKEGALKWETFLKQSEEFQHSSLVSQDNSKNKTEFSQLLTIKYLEIFCTFENMHSF